MKKIIPYILIFTVISGIFGVAPRAEASPSNPNEGCIYVFGTATNTPCKSTSLFGSGEAVPAPTPPAEDPNKTEFKKALDSRSCALNFFGGTFSPIEGCLRELSYFLFFTIPAGILYVVAHLFDTLLSLTISSYLYGDFIKEAWVVVRDISNIFFILILLYAAIEMILGLGHGAKKTIGSVVIMALLINFSMFFTRVVIDSSNILALVFYNSIDVAPNPNIPVADPAISGSLTKVTQKDISGNLVGAFDITKVMRPEMFTTQISVLGYAQEKLQDTTSLMITILIVAGTIFLFASYAFFIAGLSFLGRLVELWILLIFSPFAFMSYALPVLGNIEGIGWKNWLHKLLSTAFMAPIFMFFLYLIAMISKTPFLPKSETATTFLPMLLLIIIPSMIFIILLMKATEYAKKGSGQLGAAMIGAGKALVGLSVGGAALGLAAGGRMTAGKFMKGASTGDTAANKISENRRIASSTTSSAMEKFQANLGIGLGKVQQATRFSDLRDWTGKKLNDSQEKMEGATHARKTLDDAAQARYHTNYSKLTSRERDNIKDTIDLNILTKNRQAGVLTATGAAINYGNKQKFSELQDDEQEALKAHLATMSATGTRGGIHHGSEEITTKSRQKMGVGTTLLQSTRTGTYDARNLAELVVGEQDKTLNKLVTGITSSAAKSFRAGFSTAGIKFGNKAEGVFLKDLGATISEALKSASIKVDLSHVGEEKKEGAHGGGGGGHH